MAILSGIGGLPWQATLEKSAETNQEKKYAERHWPVYENYDLPVSGGRRYLWVPDEEYFVEKERSIDPFALEHADLFLKFARWFDEKKMDKAGEPGAEYGPSGLETPRNVEAANDWAHKYGVLGLGTNEDEVHAIGGPIGSSSTQIAARQLGVEYLGHSGTRGYRKSARGGKKETVERFVLEAYEANIVLKLYETVAAEDAKSKVSSRGEAIDTNSHKDPIKFISEFMSSEKPTYAYPPGRSPVYKGHYTPRSEQKDWGGTDTEREEWKREWLNDANMARSWALSVVENALNRKTEEDVYSILVGEPYSYEEGWGFKSLLGAMWFQMRRFMLAGDNCPNCGNVFYRRRPNMVYCSKGCGSQHRAAKSYKNRQKQHREQAREETERKLRR